MRISIAKEIGAAVSPNLGFNPKTTASKAQSRNIEIGNGARGKEKKKEKKKKERYRAEPICV